jgi:hypothetical protein
MSAKSPTKSTWQRALETNSSVITCPPLPCPHVRSAFPKVTPTIPASGERLLPGFALPRHGLWCRHSHGMRLRSGALPARESRPGAGSLQPTSVEEIARQAATLGRAGSRNAAQDIVQRYLGWLRESNGLGGNACCPGSREVPARGTIRRISQRRRHLPERTVDVAVAYDDPLTGVRPFICSPFTPHPYPLPVQGRGLG